MTLHGATRPVDVGWRESTEMELVDRARLGDEQAVRALIKRHNQRLFRAARGIVRDDAEAEDVVQETYVKAFTNLSSFRAEARLSTWLTRIAINEALGRVRRKRPHVDLAEVDTRRGSNEGQVIMFPSSLMPPGPETEAARSQIRDVLESCVDQLPDPFRLVFMLRDIEGLSTDETATQLSIKSETVKTRLHRARRLMRSAIEEKIAPTFADLFPFDGARCTGMADRVVDQLRGSGKVSR